MRSSAYKAVGEQSKADADFRKADELLNFSLAPPDEESSTQPAEESSTSSAEKKSGCLGVLVCLIIAACSLIV